MAIRLFLGQLPGPAARPPGALPATHSAEAQQESSHFDFGELRTRSCHVLLIRRIGDRMSLTPSFIPSLSDVERYKRLRRLARDLNHRIVKTVPREAMHEVGETIGILHRGVLVFDTEDEASILMDCCLYDWMRNGKNLVEKYAENHPASPGTEEHELLQAYLQAKYRIVVPRSRV